MRGQSHSTTSQVRDLLRRLSSGQPRAREALIERSMARLERLARAQLSGFPAVARWEQTDDNVQGVVQRLHRALMSLRPGSAREFFSLCSALIRRELLDLKRRHFGPEGIGAHHVSPGPAATGATPRLDVPPYHVSDTTYDPARLARWTELHQTVETLPTDLRELFDLVWYQELTHAEAAEVLGVSVKTVSRRWRDARLRLAHLVEDGQV